MARQHLRAEAYTEIGLAGFQRNADPIDLLPDPILVVIAAHRAAEDDRGIMRIHRGGQRIAETRTTEVETVTGLA